MDPFWHFARRMLRYRGIAALAIVMAAISAASLGAGLVGVVPVLRNILAGASKDPSLRELATVWNARRPTEEQLTAEALERIPANAPARMSLREAAVEWNRSRAGTEEAIPDSIVSALPSTGVEPAGNLREIVADLNGWIGGAIPQEWIDGLPTGPFTTIVVIIGALGILTVIGGTASFLHAFLSLTVVQRTVANIRREAFHRVLRLPLKEIVVGGAADKISRIVNDTATLENGFTSLLSKAVAQFLKGVGASIAALVIDWRLSISALVIAPPLYWIIRKLGKKIRRASKSALASQGELLGAANEALQGLRVVKVHTSERYEAGRFHKINKEVMRQTFRARTARALSTPVVEVLSTIVFGGLCLIAAKAVLDQKLRPEDFMATMGALFAAAASFKPLTGLLNDINVSSGAAARIREVMEATPEPGHDATLPRLSRHRDVIEFRNVTFTYPGATRPALYGIDLTVKHGQRIAVVGPNGSGKTTLLALVPRLFDPDATGGVFIDGVDIRTCSIRSLRRQIGVVTQETVLFRGTVRANIAYGADDSTQERIEAAAKRARAHEFITALPKGYDTAVGDQGLTMSGGQRQRIAIARAILREPAILILDEATSMIDADSEAKIAEAIGEFSAGRTCLIVAHRLSTVVNADRIVVMDQGRIVDQGTHGELLARCAVYKLIAENQLVKSV